MAPAIRVDGLRKAFGDVQALDGISLSIDRGEFFGLLGPNGAGKTTTVRILATLTVPDAGEVRVLGRDPTRAPREVRGLVDLMTARDRFYNRLTGWANLEFLAGINGVPHDEDRVLTVADRLDLDAEALDRPVSSFSTGMVQKLNLIRGLMLDRPVLLLDEPSLGLDPVAARAYKDILREELVGRGRTILFTSHNMYEVEELCDRVAILERGEITAVGPPDDIKATTFPNQELVLGFEGPTEPTFTSPAVLGVRQRAGLWIVELDGTGDVDAVIREAQKQGRLTRVHLREPTFEETFVRRTDRDGEDR